MTAGTLVYKEVKVCIDKPMLVLVSLFIPGIINIYSQITITEYLRMTTRKNFIELYLSGRTAQCPSMHVTPIIAVTFKLK